MNKMNVIQVSWGWDNGTEVFTKKTIAKSLEYKVAKNLAERLNDERDNGSEDCPDSSVSYVVEAQERCE